MFVLEAFGTEGQGIIGTSMVTAPTGSQYNPHVFFVVEREQKLPPSFAHWLRQRKRHPEDFDSDSTLDYDILRLLHTFDGPTELGGMFVRPNFATNTSAHASPTPACCLLRCTARRVFLKTPF